MKMKSLVAFLSLALCCGASARAQTLEWIQQLGTSEYDYAEGVSADGLGNVYISGYTEGSLAGANAGGRDAFLSKYDDSGTLQWAQQLGTSEEEISFGVSADGLGNAYISGTTAGSLGGPHAGQRDAFISKYDADGSLEWTQQLGTWLSDHAQGVSADGLRNVYIAGRTDGSLGGPNSGDTDAFVGKYDDNGNLQWIRQLGPANAAWFTSVSADGLGNVYISAATFGSLGGPNAGRRDAFLSKYDADGSLEWIQQLGTSENDNSTGVSADGLGNVYISGSTNGSLGGTNASGLKDAFVAKYDASGNLQWIEQFGTSQSDKGRSVSADGLGNVYISGETAGSLGGPNAGEYDPFISKYVASGTLQWIRQLGTSSDESWGPRVSADGLGNVFISGDTEGSLGGSNAGEKDAFVAKFIDLPVLAADFDFDGDVDGDDFLAWQVGFGTSCCTATKRDGDYDNDGDVDGDDFQGWQTEFGSGGGSVSGTVPEPAAALMMMIIVSAVACFQRCR